MSAIPVAFFLAAAVTLVVGPHGLLTWPGIAAAAAGLFFLARRKHNWAALIGLASAAVSVVAQIVFGFCAWCGLADGFFAAAGLGAAAADPDASARTRNMDLILAAVMVALSVLIFINVRSGTPSPPPPAVVGTTAGTVYSDPPVRVSAPTKPPAVEGKAKLYVSPWCSNCDEAVRIFVARDPAGAKWTPVVAPQSDRQAEEDKLRALGYKGAVEAAADVPGQGVPYLVLNNGQSFLGASRCEAWAQNNL